MKNKGFTLIELLAVLVILTIIALIATPIIIGIISDAKKQSNERTIESIEHATELYLMSGYENKGIEIPNEITLRELVNNNYIEHTEEPLNNKIFIYKNANGYITYYQGRDYLGNYSTLKELIENDTNHIKKNVLVNGEVVNKVYGTKSEQLTMKNYVLYSGQLWEVVETNDTINTIKLVSAASLTSISYGTTNDWNTSWVRKWLNEYFYSKLERTDLIKDTTLCVDKVDVEPTSYTKMNSCNNSVTAKVGLLTYEDYIYAKDGNTIQNGESFLDEDELSWLITPTNLGSTQIWSTDQSDPSILSATQYFTNTYGKGVRPVISISDKTLIKSGVGTKVDPYILSSERSLEKNTNLNYGKVGDYVYIDESNNPYTNQINETYITKITQTTPTSKVRYRIVNINEDGTVKLERADVLRNLPNIISSSSNVYIQFYAKDAGDASTNHNIFNPNDGSGVQEKDKGDSLAYYLNNATNSFYNWYSDKQKSMIVPTTVSLNTSAHGKDYSNPNTNPNESYPSVTNDGEVTANVVLPNWGEMYTGNDLNTPYWYINRWQNSSSHGSYLYHSGVTSNASVAVAWFAARPVITLNSRVYVTSGSGSAKNPYSIAIEN